MKTLAAEELKTTNPHQNYPSPVELLKRSVMMALTLDISQLRDPSPEPSSKQLAPLKAIEALKIFMPQHWDTSAVELNKTSVMQHNSLLLVLSTNPTAADA